MMKNLVFATALLFSVATAAQAHKAHVHGEGRLNVSLDQARLTLAIEIPLDAAVGFERPPRNDKEKTALAATAKLLADGGALFPLDPAAQCRVQEQRVHVPFTGSDDRHEAHAHKGETHHADIEASYVFHCAAPERLTFVDTTIFKHFKRLYRLEARHIGPKGQGAQRLTPNKPRLVW